MKERDLYLPYFSEFMIPYYDNMGIANVFTIKEDADEWLNTQKNEKICILVKKTSVESLYSSYFQMGAKTIRMHEPNALDEIILNENLKEIRPNYYNNRLNFDILKLKETRKTEYLIDMKHCRFIIAAKVLSPLNIKYATAAKKEADTYYYLAFSTLTEFGYWIKDPIWQPVEVNFKSLISISHKHPFIINPYGMRLALTIEQIKKIEDSL